MAETCKQRYFTNASRNRQLSNSLVPLSRCDIVALDPAASPRETPHVLEEQLSAPPTALGIFIGKINCSGKKLRLSQSDSLKNRPVCQRKWPIRQITAGSRPNRNKRLKPVLRSLFGQCPLRSRTGHLGLQCAGFQFIHSFKWIKWTRGFTFRTFELTSANLQP